jgi:PIF1-like helicase/Helix-turn-helix domain
MQQATALDILKTGRNVFLTGAPGTGKTHTLNTYIKYLREHRIPVAVTASTGIAATHIGGQTIHSWSGVGVRDFLSDWDLDALSQKESLVDRIMHTEVLILDEISMLHPRTLDMVETIVRTIRNDDRPFGGIQVVFTGDLFQLPPIVKRGEEEGFAPSSRAWKTADIRVCYLTHQYRQEGDVLADILNSMRSRTLNSEHEELLQGRIGARLKNTPTRLFTHNADVDAFNEEELGSIRGASQVFTMVTRGRASSVEGLVKNILAPARLTLKEGAAVMFVKNSPEKGYVNGTLGTVIDFKFGAPVVKTHTGATIVADPVDWKTEDDGKILATVTQVPLRLAWAITVHKSQGMTLDAAHIDLGRAFTPGQGYVALSRVRALEGLALEALNDEALGVHPIASHLDIEFQRDSSKWEKVIVGMDTKKLHSMHSEFISRTGGTQEAHEVVEAKNLGPKVSTYDVTRQFLESETPLVDIASTRNLTVGTIISHLEELKKLGAPKEMFSYLKPKKKMYDAIAAAFKKQTDTALNPVHTALKGVYSFDELRLVRLML